MILRKPYAILIKYFILIHIIMFISFSYLVFALRKIYLFFSDYIKTGNFTYTENMASKFVPWVIIIIVIILLALSIGIFALMNKKEKPVLFYKIMIGYCLFLLVVFIYYITFFNSLDNTVYEAQRIAINRDIGLFAYIFNFFFVAFSFIRGFGFDIKKFSFERDKKELNLEESDSEEYELNVGLEKEDIKSIINRNKRELMYYFKENKIFLTIVGVIVVVSASLYIYYDRFVINKEYVQNDYVSIGNLTYHVNSSKISKTDKYGQVIGIDNDYLIIDLSINNKERNGYLDPEAMRVHIDDEYYYPSTSCNLFSDMGNCYNNSELKTDKENNFILVYQIKKEYSDIFLEILKRKGEEYQYSKIKLFYTVEDHRETKIEDGNFVYNNNQYKINNFSFSDKSFYQYEECIANNCSTYTKKVNPNVGETLLILEFENIEGLSTDFFNTAVGIKYNNRVYLGRDIKLIDKYENKVYYSIPIYAKKIENINLLINIRPNTYNMELKGEVDE